MSNEALKWTTKYPTQPGIYWIRNYALKGSTEAAIGEVEAVPTVIELSERGDFYWTGSDIGYDKSNFDIASPEWYGPIQPPDAPSESVMEPEYGLSNGFTAMIELDTGLYRLDNWSWTRFEISAPSELLSEVISELTAPGIEGLIATAREVGEEIEYLGRQTRIFGGKLQGILAFAPVGKYEVIRKAAGVGV